MGLGVAAVQEVEVGLEGQLGAQFEDEADAEFGAKAGDGLTTLQSGPTTLGVRRGQLVADR